MFTLNQIGPTGGDETAMYEVIFDSMEKRTVGQFISELFESQPGDWGFTEIRDNEQRDQILGSFSYGQGNRDMSRITDALRERKIKHISASGGWSRMDYLIFA